ERIRVAGYQKDPGRFYAQADFVIVPTIRQEALGLVSLEARMHGLPVIYSRRGGLPGTQLEGVTGLGLDAVTAEEIAAKIVSMVSDPARYAQMCRRAPEGLEEFSIDTMIAGYLRDYVTELETM